MFQFHLAKDLPFNKITGIWPLESYGLIVGSLALKTTFLSPVKTQLTDNNQEGRILMDFLMSRTRTEEETSSKNAKREWWMDLSLEWNKSSLLGDSPPELADTHYFKIWAPEDEQNVLTRLKEAQKQLGFEIKFVVQVKNFRPKTPSLIFLLPQLIWSPKNYAEEVKIPSALTFPPTWNAGSNSNVAISTNFTGSITITCVAERCLLTSLNLFPGTGSKPRHFLQKMMDEEINCDATIVTVDGEEIKCHKFILTDQSDVFEAYFKDTSKSKESVTGTIETDDMCFKSVKAFLSYLYFDDIEDAKEDSAIALDLFKAAEKYHIPRLTRQIEMIFLEKAGKWFKMEVAMGLYFFAKKLESAEPSKMKALVVLKVNPEALNETPAFIRLFKEEPDTARELCVDIISFNNV